MRVNGKPAAANGLSGYLVTMKMSEEIPQYSFADMKKKPTLLFAAL